MRLVALSLLAIASTTHADPEAPGWRHGDHLTGEWGGARHRLADAGVTLDVIYATEMFGSESGNHAEEGVALLGHLDVALTLDSHLLGLWPGGKLYVLAQNGEGTGIDHYVGSATQISNLEADPYTQLTELFVEQALADERIVVRLGKQDANREFGTPRYGGNFINNNFGMFPTTPLPSYPTTGLGAAIVVTPLPWLATKAALYEGNPMVGSLGFDTAFADGAGFTVVGGLAATRHYGAADRHEGTTSLGVWHQTGTFDDLAMPATPRELHGDTGFFFQHDEHVYLHPDDPSDARGLNLILRFGWAQADRTDLSRFMDVSAAWHGIGSRHGDTTGVGAGYFTVASPTDGSMHPSDEVFVETFYKLRVTPFASLQPDLQFYRHPGGAGADAWIAGARLKLKL